MGWASLPVWLIINIAKLTQPRPDTADSAHASGEGGRGGMEVGGRGRLYTYHYNVTTRMTSALRWAAMRASLMFDNCEGQSHKTVSTGDNF